jgi:hypothetical protein
VLLWLVRTPGGRWKTVPALLLGYCLVPFPLVLGLYLIRGAAGAPAEVEAGGPALIQA